MPNKYHWKPEGIAFTAIIPPSPDGYSLELPAAAGSAHNPDYPVQGTFRLEYKRIKLDTDSRLWHCGARLLNLRDGSQSCVWHEDDVVKEPGVPIQDTVMKRYLAWARREKERATALHLIVQTAWDALHPDEFPDHP